MKNRLGIVLGTVFFWFNPFFCEGKVLFLAHWNDGLKADVAGGKADPVIAGGGQTPKNGNGYPFKNSMPAVNGLQILDGSTLAYATAGNMKAAEGTIDFWFYPRTNFVAGPEMAPTLFTTNVGPGAEHRWDNLMFLTYGGWSPTVSLITTDSQSKWVGSVGYLADKWTANSRWHRIAVSWSQKHNRLSMFIDGRLESRNENSKIPPSPLPCLYIGSNRGWKAFAPHSYDEFRILDRELGELEAATDYCRKYEFTNDDSFRPESLMVPIDISKVATRPFEDQEPNDQKGGWTDQGTNDMRNFKRGKVQALGMPFNIPNGCIVLASARKQYLPQNATIDINAKYGGLVFIHTAAWMMAPGRTCGFYIMNYEDGTSQTVALESFKNIGDWWYGQQMVEARPVMSCPGGGAGTVGAFAFFWQNPNPEKTIKSILFKTNNDEAIPVLIAITGVKPEAGSEVYEGIKLLTHEKTDVAGEFMETVKKYQSRLPELKKAKDSLAKVKLTDKQKGTYYGRNAAEYLESAFIYMAEAGRLKATIEMAIRKNAYSEVRAIEKAQSYIHYVVEIDKLLPGLLARADKAAPLPSVATPPEVFSAEASALFKKYPRSEIVLNGWWDANNSEDPEKPGAEWKPMLIPTNGGPKATWLKKSISIPAEWKGRSLELWFESSRLITEVYINRKFVKRHIGIEPFGAEISEAIVPGAVNEILIFTGSRDYVINPYNQGINGITAPYDPVCITQDITLRVAPRTHIVDPYARLDDKNNLIVTGQVENWPGQAVELEVAIEHEKNLKDFGKFKITPDKNGNFQISTPWDKPILWGIGGDYQQPRLVFMRLKLSGPGGNLDEVRFRTGFRRFDIQDKIYFALNGKRIFIQGDHLWASEGHYSSCTRAYLNRYYRLARGANFNMVRYHVIEKGNQYPSELDTADELGFLVEPEGTSGVSEGPRLVNGGGNADDPVFRKAIERYHRALARKYRTHPSVAIFSLSNEIFQSSDRYLNETSRLFLAMEKVVQEECPGLVCTEQGNNARKEFAIADVHYWTGVSFKGWKEKGDRPIDNGEWCIYEGGYFEMNNPDKGKAKAGMAAAAGGFEKEIKSEIAYGVAGTMPFPASYIYGFCAADPKLMGPWAEIVAKNFYYDPNRWYMPHGTCAPIPIPWPAKSGKGVKVIDNWTGTQGDNLNFFDPKRVEITPNDVYFAFKRAFNPMPPVKSVMAPEVIVTVDPKQTGLPVFATQEGNPVLMGILPDTDGKAWFELSAPGVYEFSRIDKAGLKTVKFTATEKPLAQPPGFGYIDWIDLK